MTLRKISTATRMAAWLSGTLVALTVFSASGLAESEPKDRPNYADYPVYVTRSELQIRNKQWKLNEISLPTQWSGWHYNQQSRTLNWEVLAPSTKVWVDAKQKPIYMSRCLSILVGVPPPEVKIVYVPQIHNVPTPNPFWWIPWLLLACAALLLLWLLSRYLESRRRLEAETVAAQRMLDRANAETRAAETQVNIDKQTVGTLKRQIEVLEGQLRVANHGLVIVPKDPSRYLPPPGWLRANGNTSTSGI